MIHPINVGKTLPILILCAPAALAELDESGAAQLPSPAKATQAIEQLQTQSASPERSFWLARAHLALGQMADARAHLDSIPSTHELYPHALRQRLYLAQQEGDGALQALLEQLRYTPHHSSRQLIHLLLLEQYLKNNRLPEAELLNQELRKQDLSQEQQTLLELLYIDILRLRGDYQQALDYGRQLELQDVAKRSADLRARIRLKLADIYYSQSERATSDERDRDRGRAEQTLLGFISSHPESPLISEAFAELFEQGVFAESPHALTRLKDWIKPEQLAKAARASYALKSLFLLEDPLDPEPNLSYVNTALTALPEQRASQDILLEAARRLLASGDTARAEQYIKLMKEDSPYRQFFEALLLAQQDQFGEAMDLFYHISQRCKALYEPALINATVCALRHDDEQRAEELSELICSPEARALILSAKSSHYLYRDEQRAARYACQLLEQHPNSSSAIDAQMDLIQLQTKQHPLEASTLLQTLHESKHDQWTEAQLKRYYALLVLCTQQLYNTGHQGAVNPIQVLEEAIEHCQHRTIRSFLILYLGEMLMEQKRYSDAITLYKDYAKDSHSAENKALAYLLAARSAEKLSTLPELKQAINLYEKSAHIQSSYHVEALLGAAALYIRIGKEARARQLITPLLDKKALPATQRSLIQLLLAESWAYDAMSKPELIARVLEHSATMLHSDELNDAWKNRSRIHHAHLCSRFGQHYEAMENYQLVIDQLKKLPTLTPADWYFYYYAGSAKISQLLKLTQYRTAAQLAEQLANWAETKAKEKTNTLSKQQQEIISHLRERAIWIRQQHFLITQPTSEASSRPPDSP